MKTYILFESSQIPLNTRGLAFNLDAIPKRNGVIGDFRGLTSDGCALVEGFAGELGSARCFIPTGDLPAYLNATKITLSNSFKRLLRQANLKIPKELL